MMRAHRRLLLFLCFLTGAALASPGRPRAEVSAEASFSFGAPLAPYGEWVVVAHHGRVWRPRGVAVGWRPYFHGRWVWTDDGWYWDSDEPWGWATYHYGRWYADPAYGWVWLPGYTWAPAWVTWRFGGGAIGWAPLLPGFSVWWTAGYPVQQSAWVFVPERRFVGARVDRIAYSPARSAAFLSATHLAPPRSVTGASAPRLGGPPRRYVERQIGRPIAPVRMTAAATPQAARAGRREGVVSVYRPPRLAAARPAPHPAATPSAPRHATTRSAPHPAVERSAPRHAAARSAPHHAAARPEPRHATARSEPRHATARSSPHPTARSAPSHAAARSEPRHATVRSSPHPTARSAPRHETARPAPRQAMARPAPRVAAAPRPAPPAPRAVSPGGQGRAPPQRPSPPAARSVRQAQRSSGHSTT